MPVALAWSLPPAGILSVRLALSGLDWTHVQVETTAGTGRKGACAGVPRKSRAGGVPRYTTQWVTGNSLVQTERWPCLRQIPGVALP